MLQQLLPASFKTQIANQFGEYGREWLKQLPRLIEYAVDQWQLENLQTVNNLSFNYVAGGFSKLFKANIILKISPDSNEFNNEKSALLHFQGHGVNKLFAYNDMYSMLLLEKIGNGVTLKSLFPNHDNEAIEYVAEIIKQLHPKPLSVAYKIKHNINQHPTLSQLVLALDNFNNPKIPAELITLGRVIANELIHNQEAYLANKQDVLLHGDLHHENILKTHDSKWVAIDPKGVIGHIPYEVGAFMRNPTHELIKQSNLEPILINRINRFSELLNLDKQLLIKYSYLATLLGIIWNLEDNGDYWQDWLKLLPIFQCMLQR